MTKVILSAFLPIAFAWAFPSSVLHAQEAPELSCSEDPNCEVIIAREPARGVSPKNTGRWAAQIHQNYPSEALRNEEEGTVRLRVRVNPLGRVSACTVTGSSGSPSLDAAACDGMVRYAEFDPARNADGEAISSNYNTAIRYQIPESVPVRANGNTPAMIETESWAPALFQAMGIDIEKLEGLTEDDVGVVLVSLQIDPAGTVKKCVVLMESGDPATDTKACNAATKYARFEKAAGDDTRARHADLPVPYAK